MSIKFKCAHCQKSLSVKDELAGKKGTCPGCKKVLVVPMAATVASNGLPPLPAPVNLPERNQADVEAEVAAILNDKPPEPPSDAVSKTIDFECPMCGDPVTVAADLAGKNAPCPSCSRIVKVPLPKKLEKIDWKKPNAGLPSLARQDVPAVDNAWGNKEATRVSQESLQEAGALPILREPVTVGQWIGRLTATAAGIALLVAGVAFVRMRALEEKETDTLAYAIKYMNSDAARHRLGAEGLAEMHVAIGHYHLRTHKENCAAEARTQFDKAFELLRNGRGTERDMGLSELALARLELGGTGDELEEGRRLQWEDNKYGAGVLKMVRVTLEAIRSREARLEALRPVLRRLIARGQPNRAYSLANQAFGTAGSSGSDVLLQMEAKAIAGMEVNSAGQKIEAEKIADRLVKEYEAKARPPLASSVVALALVMDKTAPKAGTGGADNENEVAGRAEGLARQKEFEKARKEVDNAPFPQLKFWAQLNLVTAALDAKTRDRADLDRAFELGVPLRGNPVSQWLHWRLLQQGLQFGVEEERLKPIADSLPDAALRARGQLALLKARLARSDKTEPEESIKTVDEQTLSRALAFEALARHNVRYDKGTAQQALSWPEPFRAFGSIGVARGLQGE